MRAFRVLYQQGRNYSQELATTASKIPKVPVNPDSLHQQWISPGGFTVTPEVWVSSLRQVADQRDSIIQLHPDVFRTFPRLDILQRNISWQQVYRNVTYIKALSRAEVPGSKQKKPWPQKGTGRARHGSTTAPQWKGGGISHGIRGPRTWFYMLPNTVRLKGLCVALTIKHAQDDLVVVDDFASLSSSNPNFLKQMAEERNWGYSVLFVESDTTTPENLILATAEIPSFNVMPTYSLNCLSMMKHETLVLSRGALHQIQERILYHMNKAEPICKKFIYSDYMELNTDENDQTDELEGQPPFI